MTWFNNDREESKPTWLNPAQKRNCVRTIRGWEIPASNSYGNEFNGWKEINATGFIPNMELIVAMPTDVTGGVTGDRVGPNYFFRGLTGAYGNGYGGLPGNVGFTAGSGRDVPNYTPYFTCPFDGDTCTAGGPFSTGVSHDGSRGSGLQSGQVYAYKTNKYGVSSLGLPSGVTAYIKVCVNDFNFTQNISITSGGQTGFSLYTGTQLLNTALVPTAVYEEFFGPTASVNNNIGVIRFTNAQATGGANSALVNRQITIGLTANDGSAASVAGITSGSTGTTRFVVRFDRGL